MKLAIILIMLSILPAAAALQFLSPANGTVYNGTTSVTFTWDEAPVQFSMDSAAPTTINSTSTTLTLTPGNHSATISNDTNTVTDTVIILDPNQSNQNNQTNQITQVITVTADQQVYEAGTSSRIRVSVTTPSQLNLVIQRNGATVDNYNINVQQQTDFLYSVSAAGLYTVTATSQTSSGSVSFTVQNTSMGVVINGPSTAVTNRVASFTSQIAGGAAPYTIFWQFSDNTTSNGASADHVFTQPGNYVATLVVTDTTGKQASATKSVTVNNQSYSLTISVLSATGKLLRNATVIVYDARAGRSLITDSFGEATFNSLSPSNYTINATYNDTRPTTPVIYVGSQNLELTSDNTATFTFSVPDSISTTSVANTTNTTNTSTTTVAATTQTAATAAPLLAAAAPQSAAPSAEEVARQVFEQMRTNKLNELNTVRTTLFRSDEKLQILTQLGLKNSYDAAQQRIQQAATAAEIQAALASIPTDVTITSKDTTISKLTTDDVAPLETKFYAARNIAAKDQKKYSYSIEQLLKNVTITTKHVVVRITNEDGSTGGVYTIFTRTIEAPDSTSFVEFVPKLVAADASQIHSDASPDVLEADPVLRFLVSQYSYYVNTETSDEPQILPVPLQLTDPPSFIGYVAVKLNIASFDHGGMYLIIIGIILAAVVLGNIYLRRDSKSTLPAFTQLTDMTLTSIEQGQYEIAGKYYTDLKDIHASLSPDEQAQTADIMTFIKDASAVHEFRTSIKHLQGVIALKDQQAIVTAYERVMQHYDELAAQQQANEKPLLDNVNEELEQHLNQN